ncbi:hypothetical protein DENSPDRAFT_930804 [Dentipellis sp. KUC8613]|nr:hypothetical protein DENSPDRAFT_930804 [Dentipellis sp. KUC8613]
MPKDNSRRLFADLIQQASTYYGNWTPNQTVEVGDYGILNRETAEFEKEGSIYDEDFKPELAIHDQYPVEKTEPDDQYIVVSRGGKVQSFDAKFGAEYPGIVQSTIKGRWQFGRGRGAVVVLHKPMELVIKNRSKLLPHLTEALQGKALVESVYKCPMYALVLTQKSDAGSDVAVGLDLAKGGGAMLKGHWNYYTSSGVWRSGGEDGGSTYYPLYTLRTPKPPNFLARLLGHRGPGEPLEMPEGEDGFETYQPPWNVLNDEGEEYTPSDEGEASDDE